MKSPRRRAREFALQGLYQWQLSGNDLQAIEAHLSAVAGFDKLDRGLFDCLLKGAIETSGELRGLIEPWLDRSYDALSPVERAILMLATYELREQPETPYKVVINEAIELAKSYGGSDGHKYVNSVLDKLAALIRPEESARTSRARKSQSQEKT